MLLSLFFTVSSSFWCLQFLIGKAKTNLLYSIVKYKEHWSEYDSQCIGTAKTVHRCSLCFISIEISQKWCTSLFWKHGFYNTNFSFKSNQLFELLWKKAKIEEYSQNTKNIENGKMCSGLPLSGFWKAVFENLYHY